ncbi:MAG: hypothetical protein J6X25_00835 [Bacteroidales bacterium]|nr:hypothetical protein [Bacteroidales bacterium]
MKHIILAIAAAIICTSCSVMCCTKSSLKGSAWTCQYGMFVADAGTETVDVTLTFPSAKKFELLFDHNMPPYPAMYMNADGSVDTMPGYSFQYTMKGTYTYKKGILMLIPEEGEPIKAEMVAGKLHSSDIPMADHCIFEKK